MHINILLSGCELAFLAAILAVLRGSLSGPPPLYTVVGCWVWMSGCAVDRLGLGYLRATALMPAAGWFVPGTPRAVLAFAVSRCHRSG